MSDTPETDAEVNELKSAITYNMVWAEFARKLEQERDIAQKAMGDARDVLLDAMPDANAPTKILAEMIVAERDLWKLEAERWKATK